MASTTEYALDRRSFLRGAAAACAAAVLSPDELTARIAAPSPLTGAQPLRLLVVFEEGNRALERGARFGVEEVERAASLLRRDVALEVLGERLGIAALRDRAGGAVVGGCRGPWATELARAAAEQGMLYLNAADDGEALRAECPRTTFHVAPAASTLAAARRMAEREGEVAPWHQTLGRFGAGQLNDRYLARFGEPMPSAAWAVWMAAKIAWESAARTRSTRFADLAAHLLDRRTRFDGHKGAPLTFRPDRELRQPLYLVPPAERAAEQPLQLPDLRGDTAPAEALDRIHPAGAERCPPLAGA